MIKMGRKPGIQMCSSDSHYGGKPWVQYSSVGYVIVSLEQWMKIHEFQSFPLPQPGDLENLSPEDKPLEMALRDVMQGTYAQRMQKCFERVGATGQMMQYNFMTPKLDSYVREVVLFQSNYTHPDRSFYPWTWVDCYIKYPFFKVIAYLANLGAEA